VTRKQCEVEHIELHKVFQSPLNDPVVFLCPEVTSHINMSNDSNIILYDLPGKGDHVRCWSLNPWKSIAFALETPI